MRLLRVREWESCIIILHMAEMGPVWEGGNVFKGYKLQSGGKGNAAHGKGKVGKFSPFIFMCWCLRRCGERVLLIDVTHNDWDLGWLRPVSFPSPLVLDRASGLREQVGWGNWLGWGLNLLQGGLVTLFARESVFVRVGVFEMVVLRSSIFWIEKLERGWLGTWWLRPRIYIWNWSTSGTTDFEDNSFTFQIHNHTLPALLLLRR